MPRIRKLLGPSRFDSDGLRLRWMKPGVIRVEFRRSGRQLTVRYKEIGTEYEFVSHVARPQVVRDVGLFVAGRELLERNRATALAGFRLTFQDGIDAWVRQRASTLHRDDLMFAISSLVCETDRFREVLTGREG